MKYLKGRVMSKNNDKEKIDLNKSILDSKGFEREPMGREIIGEGNLFLLKREGVELRPSSLFVRSSSHVDLFVGVFGDLCDFCGLCGLFELYGLSVFNKFYYSFVNNVLFVKRNFSREVLMREFT